MSIVHSLLRFLFPNKEQGLPSDLNLHACLNYSRCSRFSIYVHGLNDSRKIQGVGDIWTPPFEFNDLLASSPDEACIVVVPIDSRTHRIVGQPAGELQALNRLQGWNGGRNHVIIDGSDGGISLAERRQWLGCAAIAQSHCELTNYVHNFDISLPLSLPTSHRTEYGGRVGLKHLEAIAQLSPPGARRRYFLTFKGSMLYSSGRERRHLLLPLSRQSSGEREVAVYGRCPGRAVLAKNLCTEMASNASRAPSYLSLLNTTFALVPGGESPASMRLAEVLAAGAVPIFVSGDTASSSAYVRPFDEAVPWHEISLHFPWEAASHIVRTLESIPRRTVAKMQAAVQEAWRTHFRPPNDARTLYSMLQGRATFRYRRSRRRLAATVRPLPQVRPAEVPPQRGTRSGQRTA